MSQLKMTEDVKEAILTMLEEVPNQTAVRKLFGISSKSYYRTKEKDPEWGKAVDAAINDGYDMMEEEARRRAVEGVKEPVFYKGEEVGGITKYSDSLLMFMLKHCKPKKFNPGVKVSAGEGGNVTFVFDVDSSD